MKGALKIKKTEFVDLVVLRNKTVKIDKTGLITAKHCGTQRKLNLTLDCEIQGMFFYLTHGLAGVAGIQEASGKQHVLVAVHDTSTQTV